MTTTQNRRRSTASFDELTLVEELTRCASVAARHTTHAEIAEAAGDHRAAGEWLESAARHEDRFLAMLAEVEDRLVGVPTAGPTGHLRQYLDLYAAAWGLVDVDRVQLRVEILAGRVCGDHERPVPCLECQ